MDIEKSFFKTFLKNFDEISFNRYSKSYDELNNYQRKNITNGPGKLCKALNIDRSLSGKYILGSELYIMDNEDENFEIVTDKRINIDYAEEYKDKLWRFYIKDNPFVSKK